MAAGLGFKDFTTGEVLTAADVDGYLMQGVWVFASAAARDAAVTSPQEGNFAYLKDTNVTTYYTGSAWANLDTTGMTNPMTTTGDTIYSSSGSTPARLGIGSTGQVLTVAGGLPTWATPAGGGSGLTLIAPSSTANSGGSVSTSGGQVTYTSVSSVSLNGVFSSTYTNYLIMVDSLITSTTADILLRWRASGTDTTTNYANSYHGKPYTTSSGTVDYIGAAFGTSNYYVCDGDGSQKYAFTTFVQSPNQAQYTNAQGQSNTRSAYVTIANQQQSSTQFDGVTLYTSTGTVSGVIRVYGYSKS